MVFAVRAGCRLLEWVIVGALVAGLARGIAAQQPVGVEPPAPEATDQVTFASMLNRLAMVDWLWAPAPDGERCVQFSSFDRASLAGPGNPDAWHANDDRGKYLRRVDTANGAEFVLAEVSGPGCVARIWSANPSGTLHFDLDGKRVWSVDFAALCSGTLPGVPEPIAGVRSKGGNCYLPIPFHKSLVVSASAGDLYYHVDVVQFAAGTAVTTFAPQQLQTNAEAVQQVAARLQGAGRGEGYGSERVLPIRVSRDTVVRSLEFTAKPVRDPSSAGKAAVVEVLRRSRLVVQHDGEKLVDVPFGDFFGGGPEMIAWRGIALAVAPGVDGAVTARCSLPMPFPRGGTISILTEGECHGVELKGWAAMSQSSTPMPPDTLLFRADYHQHFGRAVQPRGDHLVLAAEGRGRFVGCSLQIRNSSRIWWGEGDEKFTVDGEVFPSWFGTGTEDYFGYAWCEPTPFSAPFHAQIECQGPMNFGFTRLHRTHVLDSVPFRRSFRLDLEVWHWVDKAVVDYATVAYWYGEPGAKSGLPAVPPAAERALPRLDRPPVFVAANALEGEALAVRSCTGGTHQVQDLGVVDQTFSQDNHRWWRDGKVGDVLTLVVPVAAAGRYRARAALVTAEDFGIVQLHLGERALGAPIDGYTARLGSTGPRELGEIEFTAGEHELRLVITGSNPAAKPGHMVGLDYLQLERLP